jgi:hypothetical protein
MMMVSCPLLETDAAEDTNEEKGDHKHNLRRHVL